MLFSRTQRILLTIGGPLFSAFGVFGIWFYFNYLSKGGTPDPAFSPIMGLVIGGGIAAVIIAYADGR